MMNVQTTHDVSVMEDDCRVLLRAGPVKLRFSAAVALSLAKSLHTIASALLERERIEREKWLDARAKGTWK